MADGSQFPVGGLGAGAFHVVTDRQLEALGELLAARIMAQLEPLRAQVVVLGERQQAQKERCDERAAMLTKRINGMDEQQKVTAGRVFDVALKVAGVAAMLGLIVTIVLTLV